MFKRFILIVATLLFLLPNETAAQITIPNIFNSGQVISSAAVNQNFSTLGSSACNRSACVLTGLLTGTSATFSSTLVVTGAVTLSSTLSVSGASTLAAVASGAITATGNVAPATGATYNSGGAAARWLTTYTGALDASGDILDSTGNLTINDALDVSGAVAFASTLSVSGNVTLSAGLLATQSANTNVFHQLINASTGNAATLILRLEAGSAVTSLVQYGSGHAVNTSAFELQNLGNILFTTGGTFTFSGGRVNSNASQPGFLCFQDVASTVFGVGTHTLPCSTEIYDNAGNFASNTFTAPVTGTYLLCASVEATTTGISIAQIATSNRNYPLDNLPNAVTNHQMHSCAFADMDASDTAIMQAVVSSGNFTANPATVSGMVYFSGRLVL